MYLPQNSSLRSESDRLPPLSSTGQVRILVVGDSGVGKSSIVHLITQGEPTRNPPRTVGCNVSLKYVDHSERANQPLSTRYSTTGYNDMQRMSPGQGSTGSRKGYFVELWDVSGHEEYKSSRSLFYNQINGVIFVHDLSRRKSRVSALHWLGEVAKMGTFSSPSMPRRPGLLPVPLLVIGNKVDVPEIDPVLKGANRLWQYLQGSKGVRAAKSWAERNQLLGFGRATDLPDYIRNPHSSGLIACAREGRLDMHAVMSFFVDLIERRYFMESMPPLPSPSKSWTDPYFSKMTSANSGEAGALAPRPPYLGLDPLFSAVHSEESRPAFLPTAVKGSASNDWAQSNDHYELRIDADNLALSDSRPSLATFERMPEPHLLATPWAAGVGAAPRISASTTNPLATPNGAPGLQTAALQQPHPAGLKPPGLPASLHATYHASGLQALPGAAEGEKGGIGRGSDGAPLGWSRDGGRSEVSLAPSSSWGSFSLAQEEMGIGMGTRAHCPGPSTPPLPPPQAKLLSPILSTFGEEATEFRDGTNGAAGYQHAEKLDPAYPRKAKDRMGSLLPGNGIVDARDGRNGAAPSHAGEGFSTGNGLAASEPHYSRHDAHASTRGGASEPGARSSAAPSAPTISNRGTHLRPSPQQEQPVDGALGGAKDKGGGESTAGRTSGLVSSGPLWPPPAPESSRLRTQEDPETSPHAPYSQQPLSSHSRDLLNICA